MRLDYDIKAVGAKRAILDTIEALFSGLDNASILRAELETAFTAEKDKLEKLIAREEARLRISEESRGRFTSLRKAV